MPETIDTIRLRPGLRHRARNTPTLRACINCGKRTTSNRCPNCTDPGGLNYFDPAYRQKRAHTLATSRTCWICGKPATKNDPMTFDHNTPLAHGGPLLGEGRPAHRSCNSRRGATQGVRKISTRSTPRNSPATVPREKRVESGKAA